jgi:hypothetical protein
MSKRARLDAGFFKTLLDVPLPRSRSKPKLEVFKDDFLVERIIAKRQRGRDIEYLIKGQNFFPEDNTWEPSRHIPLHLRDSFEIPSPHSSLVEDGLLRIGLLFERGLKASLMSDVSHEVRHDVMRTIFPIIPSTLKSSWHELNEGDVTAK